MERKTKWTYQSLPLPSWLEPMVLGRVLSLLYWKKYYSIKIVKILRKLILLTGMLVKAMILVLSFLWIVTYMLLTLVVGPPLNVN